MTYYVPDRETGYVDYPQRPAGYPPRDCNQCDRVMSENGGPMHIGDHFYCGRCGARQAEVEAAALRRRMEAGK